MEISRLSSSPPLPSLEEELGAFLPETDSARFAFRFSTFFGPNEITPVNVKPHLESMKPGWIVSVGTERSIFDLLLAPDCCEGVIICDVSRGIKAYVDATILLLRLCETKEELQYFSPYQKETENELLLKLQNDTSLPPNMKEYYLKNFHSLMLAYHSIPRSWCSEKGDGDFSQVNYYRDDALFQKAKRFATDGRIIAQVVKNIAAIDFTLFPRNLKVTVIDLSNVPEYVPCDEIRTLRDTLLIWTHGVGRAGTQYYSATTPLTARDQLQLLNETWNADTGVSRLTLDKLKPRKFGLQDALIDEMAKQRQLLSQTSAS